MVIRMEVYTGLLKLVVVKIGTLQLVLFADVVKGAGFAPNINVDQQGKNQFRAVCASIYNSNQMDNSRFLGIYDMMVYLCFQGGGLPDLYKRHNVISGRVDVVHLLNVFCALLGYQEKSVHNNHRNLCEEDI